MSIVTNIQENDEAEASGAPRRPRHRARQLLGAAMAVTALLAGTQMAGAGPNSPPDVPTDVSVPAGNVLSGVGHARGFQIYSCQALANGHGWILQQPQAVLLAGGHKPFALHYGGPSWTAVDGSTVVATKAGSAPAPSSSDIPWFLLKATSKSGPDGGTFTSTTFIQRVNTSGGLAPASACDADHVGATVPVYYTADYYFYDAA